MKNAIVAVTNDWHCGSTVGLYPSPGVMLDDGGVYEGSKLQEFLWQHWTDYWARVKKLRRGKKLICVVNGEFTDGDHHNTTQLVSRNLQDQRDIALACCLPMQRCKPDAVYVTRGTPSHVGRCGENEESIAGSLGAKLSETNKRTRHHLLLEVNGVLMDIAHHGKVGGTPRTKHNASMALAADTILNYTLAGERVPDLVLRAHRHEWSDSGDNYPVRVIQVGGWQGATEYVHRINAGPIPKPVGGVIVDCYEPGKYRVEKLDLRIKMGAPCRE